MAVDASMVAALAVLAVILAGAAAGLAGAALAGQRRVARAARVLGDDDALAVLQSELADVDRLRAQVKRLTGYTEELRAHTGSALSGVGVVRYDAFEDMGGRLSFSVALLDEHGDGLVLTSINGRSETRTYIKIVAHANARGLSEEEAQAVRQARTGRTDEIAARADRREAPARPLGAAAGPASGVG